jgi:hypothetical protein
MSWKIAVDEIMRAAFGDHEWWKSSTEESFRYAAEVMLEAGVQSHKIVMVLATLRSAMADEYGD